MGSASSSPLHQDLGANFPKTTKFMRLQNLGNTCYANSLTQAFLNSQRITDWIRQISKELFKTNKNSKYTNTPLFRFSQILKARDSSRNSEITIAPSEFVKIITSLNPELCIGKQNDVHELFVFLIVSFDETISRLNEECQCRFPLFSSMFSAHSVTECQCLACGTTATSQEDFLNFYVSIKERQSLTARLKNAQAPDFIAGNGKRFCNKCKVKQEMKMVCSYDKLPPVAVFQIQRFEVDRVAKTTRKLHGHVPFPNVLKLNDSKYELQSIIVHIGSTLRSGHYVTLLRMHERWILASDTSLKVLDNDDVESLFAVEDTAWQCSTAPYILMYEIC